MPKLTDTDRATIKAANPDAFVLRSPVASDSDFVFRAPRITEFDTFLMALNSGDDTEKTYAHRMLAKDTLLFPDAATWDVFALATPGLAHAFGVDLASRCGLGAEVQSDVL